MILQLNRWYFNWKYDICTGKLHFNWIKNGTLTGKGYSNWGKRYFNWGNDSSTDQNATFTGKMTL